MRLYSNPDVILSKILADFPAAGEALKQAEHIQAQLLPYQAAALFALVRPFNRVGATILEIGTAAGYSAAIMAQAAPRGFITTLNSAEHEVIGAMVNLELFMNVHPVCAASWDYLVEKPLAQFDVIFVDGDHGQIVRDMPWWDRVEPGGLMLFHDYSPKVCPPVYEAVNQLASDLDRDGPDVTIMDDKQIGLAGLYKIEDPEGEWQTLRQAVEGYVWQTSLQPAEEQVSHG